MGSSSGNSSSGLDSTSPADDWDDKAVVESQKQGPGGPKAGDWHGGLNRSLGYNDFISGGMYGPGPNENPGGRGGNENVNLGKNFVEDLGNLLSGNWENPFSAHDNRTAQEKANRFGGRKEDYLPGGKYGRDSRFSHAAAFHERQKAKAEQAEKDQLAAPAADVLDEERARQAPTASLDLEEAAYQESLQSGTALSPGAAPTTPSRGSSSRTASSLGAPQTVDAFYSGQMAALDRARAARAAARDLQNRQGQVTGALSRTARDPREDPRNTGRAAGAFAARNDLIESLSIPDSSKTAQRASHHAHADEFAGSMQAMADRVHANEFTGSMRAMADRVHANEFAGLSPAGGRVSRGWNPSETIEDVEAQFDALGPGWSGGTYRGDPFGERSSVAPSASFAESPGLDLMSSVGQHGLNNPEDVAALQDALVAGGHMNILNATGYINTPTVDGIRAAQKAAGLPTTGTVDPFGRTEAALAAALQGPYAGIPQANLEFMGLPSSSPRVSLPQSVTPAMARAQKQIEQRYQEIMNNPDTRPLGLTPEDVRQTAWDLATLEVQTGLSLADKIGRGIHITDVVAPVGEVPAGPVTDQFREAWDRHQANLHTHHPAQPQDVPLDEALDVAAFGLSFAPVVGDVVGLANDIRNYSQHPEMRTWDNYALSAAGLIPGVPSVAGVVGKQAKNIAKDPKTPKDPGFDDWAKSQTYKDAPYHHPGSRGGAKGGKSPSPKDPETSLRNSARVKDTSPHRVGIDPKNREISVMMKTRDGEWHGHVRSYKDLTQKQKNALKDIGLDDETKSKMKNW